jgi:hypothetical protein
MDLRSPTIHEEKEMLSAFCKDLDSNMFRAVDYVQSLACSTCDTMSRLENPVIFIDVVQLATFCKNSQMTKQAVEDIYPEILISQYTVPHVKELESFVLSPASVVDKRNDSISICKRCYDHFIFQKGIRKNRRTPPIGAIIAGFMIGEAPEELQDLNDIELALCSSTQTNCQTWIYFAGCHQHIQGWHTFYENRPAENIGMVSNLAEAGMKGQLLVVLCGPFTKTQIALTRKRTLVNSQKVLKAFHWLKNNNIHYSNLEIPQAEDLPVPVVIDDNM